MDWVIIFAIMGLLHKLFGSKPICYIKKDHDDYDDSDDQDDRDDYDN